MGTDRPNNDRPPLARAPHGSVPEEITLEAFLTRCEAY